MGMNLTTGEIRPLDTEAKRKEFEELCDELQSDEVGVFGEPANLARLQRMVQQSNAPQEDEPPCRTDDSTE
jgi:hypothetical protein